ncbi:hypothetical protein [Nitratidesulfovibrio sp. SRB-5]|uniref:hypothetical protein n=1 Tax=Nitratidesulfovibrio sp. SRB-5 TaxID=2872636 RepID=UPI001024DD9A|nr:hypothetical protein [Nitratidesulfovibrio sp. SRB-5]MBZ2172203.1 hypothetical protein [Nitratidesulfovibrio sp. SRB-5]RXF77395.1 hypothetical protein EKK70_07035 [Desulfovibrio sp. DS-1]
MTTMHGGLKGPDNMHVPYAWEFATQAARETGVGVDASGIGKLARQVDDNSLWMLVGTDPVTWKAAGGGGGFEPGTRMLFQQSTAPTGWTKDASHNDKALRVVSGAVGSGGSVGFSTLFGRTATDAFTLTTAHMPSHGHSTSVRYYGGGGNAGHGVSQYSDPWLGGILSTNNAGSGGAHSHGLDMRVKYVDLIIAQKD